MSRISPPTTRSPTGRARAARSGAARSRSASRRSVRPRSDEAVDAVAASRREGADLAGLAVAVEQGRGRSPSPKRRAVRRARTRAPAATGRRPVRRPPRLAACPRTDAVDARAQAVGDVDVAVLRDREIARALSRDRRPRASIGPRASPSRGRRRARRSTPRASSRTPPSAAAPRCRRRAGGSSDRSRSPARRAGRPAPTGTKSETVPSAARRTIFRLRTLETKKALRLRVVGDPLGQQVLLGEAEGDRAAADRPRSRASLRRTPANAGESRDRREVLVLGSEPKSIFAVEQPLESLRRLGGVPVAGLGAGEVVDEPRSAGPQRLGLARVLEKRRPVLLLVRLEPPSSGTRGCGRGRRRPAASARRRRSPRRDRGRSEKPHECSPSLVDLDEA